MSEIVKIVAPTNNVNDTSVVVYEFLVDDGAEVKTGQQVIAVETSKATTNIESPANGFIRFMVQIGDEIPNGDLLAVVSEDKEQLASFQSETKGEIEVNATEAAPPIAALNPPVLASIIPFGIFNKTVTLGEIYAMNGSKVQKGAVLCKVRSDKDTEDIIAPVTGYVHWNVESYKPVAAGQSAGSISDSPFINPNNEDLSIQYDSLRISHQAQKLLDERKLSAADLELTGLVTADIVRQKLDPNKRYQTKERKTAMIKIPAMRTTGGKYEKLTKAKLSEATFLANANKEPIVSQVSVLVPTQGIFTACLENLELASKFSSIIIFETGKLLKHYKQMLSIYDDERLFVYDHINIGYALSIDDGLKVPVFKDVDQKNLNQIISQKEQFVEKYISHKLSPDDLAGGTFTITDLSSTGCYLFNPVLNLGQSVILGIGGENPERTNYPLILAFDHRVIDGATATEFLVELKDRLVPHENVLLGDVLPGNPEQKNETGLVEEMIDPDNLICDSCYRTAAELDDMEHYLFKVIDKFGKEKHICSICVEGW